MRAHAARSCVSVFDDNGRRFMKGEDGGLMLSLLRFGVASLCALVSGLEGAFYGVLACESTCMTALEYKGKDLLSGPD